MSTTIRDDLFRKILDQMVLADQEMVREFLDMLKDGEIEVLDQACSSIRLIIQDKKRQERKRGW
jgi:hypothetical protein